MQFENFLFNLFYFLISSSALCVIFSENSVYSIFFLILTFCNVIFLLLLLGAEFLAFLLLIVYVGAIAVLFLFVIMMLNIKTTKQIPIKQFFVYYLPVIFLLSLFILDSFWEFFSFFDLLKNLEAKLIFTNWISEFYNISNLNGIGNVLYTKYCFLFIIAGLVLLVAMIGVIVLTIHQKTFFLLKKQTINYQLIRESKKVIKFIYLRK
nr:NADH dehydrogenase subunit 6 [Polysiphonia sp.]